MSKLNDTLAKLEFKQIGWVVPDINVTLKFLEKSLRVEFPEVTRYNSEELGIKYHGKVVAHEGLVSQTYNGGTYIELIQPLSGQSLFGDYLKRFPLGGVQHMAFRCDVREFDAVIEEIGGQGYQMIGEVDHSIARMKFFDTYTVMGVATEIMGITQEGWKALGQIEGKTNPD